MAVRKEIALADLGMAKRFMGIATTDTTDDRLIDELLGHASALIAKELGTNIVEKTYTMEMYDGGGTKIMYLNNYPVTSVHRVSIDRDNAATVTYTGAGTHATVEVVKGRLRVRTTVSGVTTQSDLTFASNVTLSDLKTAVDAYTGWAMTVVSGFSEYPSSDLIVRPAQDANDITINLKVPDDPIEDFEVYPDYGALYRGGLSETWITKETNWPLGQNNIVVDYVAGYAYSDIPEPLQAACLEVAKVMYDMTKKDSGLKSEKIGDYQYSMADRLDTLFSSSGKASTSNLVALKLAPYRRRILM